MEFRLDKMPLCNHRVNMACRKSLTDLYPVFSHIFGCFLMLLSLDGAAIFFKPYTVAKDVEFEGTLESFNIN